MAPARLHRISPWWVAGEFGEGEIKLSSNQSAGNRLAKFAMGFAGGRQIGDRLRLGLHLNGWLIQAFSLNNPAVGESVSNTGAVADGFLLKRVPLFVRGGVGWAAYTNNRPSGVNGSGLCWEGGGGYEFPVKGSFGLMPIIEYSQGGYGDARDPGTPITGRRYSVTEFKFAVVYHFGGRRN